MRKPVFKTLVLRDIESGTPEYMLYMGGPLTYQLHHTASLTVPVTIRFGSRHWLRVFFARNVIGRIAALWDSDAAWWINPIPLCKVCGHLIDPETGRHFAEVSGHAATR